MQGNTTAEKLWKCNLMQENVFWAFFKLVRLDYSIFGALGVFLSGFLAGDLHGFQLEYLVAFLIVFFYRCRVLRIQ